jgi:hypothetical protein
MTPLLSAATVPISPRYVSPEATSSMRLILPIERATPSKALGRTISEPIAPLALERASAVFAPLRHELEDVDSRTAVTRTGEAVLTFIRDRKYAVLTADNDGDLILTLTDRGSDDEAEAEVILGDVAAVASKIRGFLGR